MLAAWVPIRKWWEPSYLCTKQRFGPIFFSNYAFAVCIGAREVLTICLTTLFAPSLLPLYPLGVPTVASGRRRSQALEMPFFGQKPPFEGSTHLYCGL